MSLLKLSLTLVVLAIATVSTVVTQVPPEKQFRVINNGDFDYYITEYDASCRFIYSTETVRFSSYRFRLFFYNTTPSAYVLGLRAGLSRDEDIMRWVWDANRNNPVGENATLSLGRNGNLVLAESDGRVKWQTNTVNKGVTGFQLLPNGNIVLHDKNGRFVWQSFDHPTDTLLTGQRLTINGVNKLVSRKSDVDGSDGPYSMVLDNKGFVMYVNKTGQALPYGGWRNSDFRGSVTFEVRREFENLITTQRCRNYNATMSYLRLGSDGSFKGISYYDPATYQVWEESFSFFSRYFVRECGLPSYCGDFGYCDDAMCAACPTPKGLLGWSRTCSPPKTTQFCGSKGKKVNYYKIVGVEHFSGPYVDNGQGPITVSECKAKCDGDCKCLGFFYEEKEKKCLTAPLLGTLIKEVNTSIAYIKY